ncbi:MAG: amino acid-binding protein [Gammaproteobacteria bacterium]|nr:amino acid-binding protein [Gammaproteobacteria bacterium]
MESWYMLTLVGRDRPGIVAEVTQVLYEAGCLLGEASMLRLGGNFTIMLMVGTDGDGTALNRSLQQLADALDLRIHLDPAEGAFHEHPEANICVTISGADRAGIVAQATRCLAGCGFNILNLESTVAGSVERPLYVLHIEGQCPLDAEAIEQRLIQDGLRDLDVSVHPMETMIA